MRIYWKYYLIPFVYGVISSWYGTFHVKGVRKLSSLVAHIGGMTGEINPRSVASMIEEKLPYILFVIFFSTYIYRHFCNCSAYVFSRCEKRGFWYAKEAIKLFFFSLLYILVLLFGGMFPGLVAGKFIFDALGWYFLVHYVVTMVLWIFQLVLAANLAAILFGSSIGCLMSIGAYISSTVSLLGIDCGHLEGWNLWRLACNSSSYLVFNWHQISFRGKSFLGGISYPLSFAAGYLYFAILTILMVLAGYVIIQKTEITAAGKA